MLEIKDICVEYEKKIFVHTDFKCGIHQITVVCGQSGSGKTTLLDIISLKHESYSYYLINNRIINKELLKNNIYYSRQEPIFEENLTMRENLDLLYELYGQTKNSQLEDKIAKELELEHTFDMYVNSLSTGEKKRFSLLTAVVIKRKIVLLDEPTASIDKNMRKKVINIIDIYLKDSTVIISTHDKDILHIADVIYNIDKYKLNLVEGIINQEELGLDNNKSNNVYKYYCKTFKHKKLYTLISQALSVLVISILIIGLFSVDLYTDYQNKKLDSLFTNQFIVYSPITENSVEYEQNEYPLTEEQLNQIKNMHIVKKVRNLYCISQFNSNQIKFHNQNVFNDENEIDINYVSYDETRDYQEYIKDSFNNSGIYISKEIANRLNNINKGDTLTFSLPVPQYNVFNEGYVIEENDLNTPSYYIVYPKEHNVTVTLPIAGVLEDNISKMGMTLSLGSHVIYIPQSIYQNYINQYKVDKSYTKGKIEYKPYVPNAYVVELNSVNDVQSFQESLETMGLRCDSEYFNIYSYVMTQQNTREYHKKVSITVTIGICTVILVLKYLKRKEENSFFDYLDSILMNNHYSKSVQMRCLSYKMVITFLLSLMFSYGTIFLITVIYKQSYDLSFISILVCFIFSFFIEFIPMFFSKISK